MARLVFGLPVFVRGVHWWMSHEAMPGVCYFPLFLWIARRRQWTGGTLEGQPRDVSATASITDPVLRGLER